MKRPDAILRRLPRRRNAPPRTVAIRRISCSACGTSVVGSPLWERLRVCESCGHHHQRSAREVIGALLDSGTFRETDGMLGTADPLTFEVGKPYAKQVEDLQARTGEADAIVTGTGRLRGREVVVVALDFGFLGGSMGAVVGEKVARAADRATRHHVPLLTVSASGGARMQEGMISLLQMAKCSAAMQRLRQSGTLNVAVMTNPTTGGVFASYASLADVVIAEPGSLVGFAGPRVAEAVIGRKLPPGTHTAEAHVHWGTVDAIVDRRHQRSYLGTLLEVTGAAKRQANLSPASSARSESSEGAWETVEAARAVDRPTSRDYLRRMMPTFVELHGDRSIGDDPSVVVGFGLLDDHAVAVAALERHPSTGPAETGGHPLPEGFRKATRIFRLAERLGLPMVTLVDTPGAWPGAEAEERGLGAALSETMATLVTLRVPTVAAVIGEGGSGGALAFAASDRVLMQERAIYSVIAPEGAAAILLRDAARAPELADALHLTATPLVGWGIVDAVVAEPDGGAAADPDRAATLLAGALADQLAAMARISDKVRLRQREQRYRSVGSEFVVPVAFTPTRRGVARLSAIARHLPGRRSPAEPHPPLSA